MQPAVSMVVPCYNKVKYIGAFLKSVYEQIWDNIELILVNDGSTDGTREIIGEWEPRFLERGYKVIIIDQENKGLPGAVKAGMLRAGGEYFCTVDCDDELDPEYISKMAGFLEENSAYEWVSCDYITYSDTENGRVYNRAERNIRHPILDNANFAERFLLGCSGSALVVWVYMTRVRYLIKCGVAENFYDQNRRTQEPQYFIPMAVGGGKLKVLPDKLYKYNIYPEQMSTRNSYELRKEYRRQYLRISERTIRSLSCPNEQKQRLLFIEKFGALQDTFAGGTIYGRREDVEESALALIDFLNVKFSPPPEITQSRLEAAGAEIIYAAVKGNMLGGTAPGYNKTGRLIACGSMGKTGRKYLPRLINTPLDPDILWDGGAEPDSKIYGLAVTRPDYDSLLPDDTVLIFSRIERVANEIKEICSRSGVTNFIDYYDMLDILSAHYFPQLYGDCKFTPGG